MKIVKWVMACLSIGIIATSCQKEAASFIETNNQPPVVDAGPRQTIVQPPNSATLTGTVVSSQAGVAGHLWSLVSGPNVPVISSPSSATTLVSSLVTGTYIFQYMVIDSAGLTGVDTTSLQVLPAPPVTLTLQPAANPNELNFAGYANGSNISAHLKELCAGTWTNSGNTFTMRGALRFDLSSIPAGATITSAKLTLYSIPDPQNGDQVNANLGPDNSMFIQRITQNWNAATATWLTQPTTTTVNQLSIPHTAQNFLDLVDLDVLALVNDMRTQGNYGFQMRLQTEVIYNVRQFASSMHVNAALHPKLVVVYQQ